MPPAVLCGFSAGHDDLASWLLSCGGVASCLVAQVERRVQLVEAGHGQIFEFFHP